jgi:hypothetical protein
MSRSIARLQSLGRAPLAARSLLPAARAPASAHAWRPHGACSAPYTTASAQTQLPLPPPGPGDQAALQAPALIHPSNLYFFRSIVTNDVLVSDRFAIWRSVRIPAMLRLVL